MILCPGQSAIRALGSLCAEAGKRTAPLSPHPFLRWRHSSSATLRIGLLLTKPNTSCTIEMPASLRSDGVWVHPGMPFGFLSELAFRFTGIPNLCAEGCVPDFAGRSRG
jgi:hypothetical protein